MRAARPCGSRDEALVDERDGLAEQIVAHGRGVDQPLDREAAAQREVGGGHVARWSREGRCSELLGTRLEAGGEHVAQGVLSLR